VGDPLDWDYSPDTTSATQAVAGNASDAGQIGDVVTCLIPYSDDLLVIGGGHTLWIMRGDPAAGGNIDSISYQTGIAGPDAYTWDPQGTLYFFGSGTLWRMTSANAPPEPLSQGKLDETFRDIDVGLYRVQLSWDDDAKGVHVFLTPHNQPSEGPDHYWWDARTEGFWQDKYPAVVGPTAVLMYNADNPNNQALLAGGWDGYIRYFDPGLTTDDGTVITSYVDYPPVALGGTMANARLIELVPILAANSDPVLLTVYAESTVERAADSVSPRLTRWLTSGRNTSIRSRIRGNAIRLCLANSSAVARTWAIESLTGVVVVSGKTRGRV